MDKRKKFAKGEEGFTFIELMVGSVIFLVGILSLATLQINAMRTNSAARSMTEATTIASDRIERLMTETWTDRIVGPDLAPGSHAETVGGCDVVWEVTDSEDGRCKTLDLVITWQDSAGAHRLGYMAARVLN